MPAPAPASQRLQCNAAAHPHPRPSLSLHLHLPASGSNATLLPTRAPGPPSPCRCSAHPCRAPAGASPSLQSVRRRRTSRALQRSACKWKACRRTKCVHVTHPLCVCRRGQERRRKAKRRMLPPLKCLVRTRLRAKAPKQPGHANATPQHPVPPARPAHRRFSISRRARFMAACASVMCCSIAARRRPRLRPLQAGGWRGERGAARMRGRCTDAGPNRRARRLCPLAPRRPVEYNWLLTNCSLHSLLPVRVREPQLTTRSAAQEHATHAHTKVGRSTGDTKSATAPSAPPPGVCWQAAAPPGEAPAAGAAPPCCARPAAWRKGVKGVRLRAGRRGRLDDDARGGVRSHARTAHAAQSPRKGPRQPVIRTHVTPSGLENAPPTDARRRANACPSLPKGGAPKLLAGLGTELQRVGGAGHLELFAVVGAPGFLGACHVEAETGGGGKGGGVAFQGERRGAARSAPLLSCTAVHLGTASSAGRVATSPGTHRPRHPPAAAVGHAAAQSGASPPAVAALELAPALDGGQHVAQRALVRLKHLHMGVTLCDGDGGDAGQLGDSDGRRLKVLRRNAIAVGGGAPVLLKQPLPFARPSHSCFPPLRTSELHRAQRR